MDRIQCRRCGNCCTEPILPINDEDARQIAKATGLPVSRFVAFVSFKEVKWPKDEDDWVQFRQGRRLMTIAKKSDRCFFLTDQGCAIYKNRPRVCHIFPLDFKFYEDGELAEAEEQDRVDCDASTPDFLDDDHPLVCLGWLNYQADQIYRIRVQCWNKLRPNGTVGEFLRFLGLDAESLARGKKAGRKK